MAGPAKPTRMMAFGPCYYKLPATRGDSMLLARMFIRTPWLRAIRALYACDIDF